MAQFESLWRLWDATAVATVGSVTSPALDLRWSDRTGYVIWLKAFSSAGTADVKIEAAFSADGVTFGSFDTSLTASSNTLWTGNNPEDYHIYPLDPVGMPWCKIKVTGVGSNNADTVVTATLIFTETLPSSNEMAMVSRYWDDAI